MMEGKDGEIIVPDLSIPIVSDINARQTFDLQQYKEDISNNLNQNVLMQNSQTSNAMMYSVKSANEISANSIHLGNPDIHTSMAFVPTQESHQMDSSRTNCEDERLLNAAKSGLTDVILQLIEEEGQQLHSYRDKVGKDIYILLNLTSAIQNVIILTQNFKRT